MLNQSNEKKQYGGGSQATCKHCLANDIYPATLQGLAASHTVPTPCLP